MTVALGHGGPAKRRIGACITPLISGVLRMNALLRPLILLTALTFAASTVLADEYEDAINVFKNSGESGNLFAHCAGYAVFPSVAKGGLGVGAAHGKGRVYDKNGKHIGDSTLTQVSVGLQAGGQAYSEIVFFQDDVALTTFQRGNFEFGAGVQAVAITASAGAQTTTAGSSASASGSQQQAAAAGAYHNGLAVFTLPKGGAMVAATVGGQKFSYKAAKVASE
jgi:lipid-binding SYLF domain-containing protein